MTPLEAALEYVALGWPVLPVGGDNGKKPLVPHGVSEASADPEQVRRWWARWPDANVAIATGAPGPDVLDIDNPDLAGDALDALGDTQLGPAALTFRGGHYYWKGTDGGTIKLPYGELRRKGSYVMAPPSVRPDTDPVEDARGFRYAWVRQLDTPLPPEPGWLTEGRQTAGAGVMLPVDKVPPGAMYDHLLDLAVRLARAGILDGGARERILDAEFAAVRDPAQTYGGDPNDTRRLAYAPTDILEREQGDRLPTPPTGGGEGALTFRTPAELRENLPDEPAWIWRDNLAEGFITVVGGRPKVGKSTLVYEALDRLVRGEASYLGSPLTQTDVVLVSEEHAVTALNKLGDSPRLHVLTRDAAWPLPEWRSLIGASVAEAKRTDAKLLLIDSFTFWSGMEAEAGQDAGAVQAAVKILVAAAREGIAVLLIHHQRKAGGEFGDALLGSTAFAANADIILEVERMDEAPVSYRAVRRVGRWPSPPVLVTAWTPDDGYTLVTAADSTEDAEDHVWKQRIEAALAPRPDGRRVPMRQTDLIDLLGADSRRWGRAMRELTEAGAVVKTGAGKQTDPFTFTSVAPEDRIDAPAI